MADRDIQLPRVGDVWIFKRADQDRCDVERVFMRRGVPEPVVEVLHNPGRILNERRLSWFLSNYRLKAAGAAEG